MPATIRNSGYASTGGLIGLLASRCSIDGALAACWKRRGVGRMLVLCEVGVWWYEGEAKGPRDVQTGRRCNNDRNT